MTTEIPCLTIRTIEDADRLVARVREAAKDAQAWLLGQVGDPLGMLRRIKFDRTGFHPITHEPLNLVEQVNQTWTFWWRLAPPGNYSCCIRRLAASISRLARTLLFRSTL